ncbi:MAG: anti-sigma factor family protein [Planctomycetota bacterium]|jgi:hypothetical protein
MTYEKTDIDELLTGFLDDELDERHITEVHRLIKHDTNVAERLMQLKKTRDLLGALPFAEAPAGMLDDIQARLERNTLLEPQPEAYQQRKGSLHLMTRRLLAAAAMIGLLAVLATVVYTIVAPPAATKQQIAYEDWDQPIEKTVPEIPRQPEAVQPQKPASPIIAADAEKSPDIGRTQTLFTAKLLIETHNFIAVDAFMSRTVQTNTNLLPLGPRKTIANGSYALLGTRQGINQIIADLKDIWRWVDSAGLVVETGTKDEPVSVKNITPDQFARIIAMDSLENQIIIARNFAALNNMAELLPSQRIYAGSNADKPNLLSVPKPVLTSSRKTAKKPSSRDAGEKKLSLMITISDLAD